MKKLIFIQIALTVSLIASGQNEKIFALLDSRCVMGYLFNTSTFNSKKEAVWMPGKADEGKMVAYEDGYGHTTMDTIMDYTSNGKDYAIVIFSTHQYSPVLSMAKFSKENHVWILQGFQKYLTALRYCKENSSRSVSLEKMGCSFYCLKLETEIIGHQGYFGGFITYYSLHTRQNKFETVLSYAYYDSNEGVGAEIQCTYSDATSLKKIALDKEYYLIELTTIRNSKYIHRKETYTYCETERRYVKVGG